MKRDLGQLTGRVFDAVVIGGGAYGLFAAWDAAMRGLSVALVDKGDFGSATSFNSLRVIHGGLRYLQHGDVGRMRVSIKERTTFMSIAPHLVHPLPILIPTYGHGMRGRELMGLALKVHDAVGFDRNRLPDPAKSLPASRIVSPEECLGYCPGMDTEGLTGAALVYDTQMYSSERMLAAIMRSAYDAGAVPANYLEVTGFLQKDGGDVTGVKARDIIAGNNLEVRARVVVNATGPWAYQMLGLLDGRRQPAEPALSKAFNLLVNRQLVPDYSFGAYSKSRSTDRASLVNKGSRIFFINPWQGLSFIGTEHLPYHGHPDEFEITEEEIQQFIQDINAAYPSANLTRNDVLQVYGGMLPADGYDGNSVRLSKAYRVMDHRKEGINGLVSAVGVKFTESRHVAEKVVDLVSRKLGRPVNKCATGATPVYGGSIDDFDTYLRGQVARGINGLGRESIHRLVHLYGAAYHEVLKYLPQGGDSNGRFTDTDQETMRVIKAQIAHAVQQEMAQTLSDALLRRAALGMTGLPSGEIIDHCAHAMGQEMGWDILRIRREIQELRNSNRGLHAGTPAAQSPVSQEVH